MNIAFTATLSDRVIDRDTLPPPPRAFTAGISGFSYEDLRDVAQLPRLMDAFDAHARAVLDPGLWDRFVAYRHDGGHGASPEEISELLVAVAPVVSDFLGRLFGVEAQLGDVAGDIGREGVIFEFKREFVKKRTARRKRAEIEALDAAGPRALDQAARAVLSARHRRCPTTGTTSARSPRRAPLVRAEDLFRKARPAAGWSPPPTTSPAPRKPCRRARRAPAALAQLADTSPPRSPTRPTPRASTPPILDVVDRWCLLRMVDHATTTTGCRCGSRRPSTRRTSCPCAAEAPSSRGDHRRPPPPRARRLRPHRPPRRPARA
jgi:hypothetical protein